MMDVVGDAEEVARRVAHVIVRNIRNSASHAVDSLVRQIFRLPATARGKNRNKPPANLFITQSGRFPIVIQPGKKPIELSLLEDVSLTGRRHSSSKTRSR